MGYKKFAVYVNSYDGSSDIWDTFFKIYDTYWSDCPYCIYLINNEKEYSHKRVQIINTGVEINWFHRTIKSLAILKEEYILFLLEDYFISKEYNEHEINGILSFIIKNKIFYYQLSPKGHGNSEIVPVCKNYEYPISLQPAIWHRETLLSILKDINAISPLDFECYYNKLYDKTSNDIIPGAYYDNRDILGYKNGVLRGKWIPSTIRFFRKHGIMIYTGKRARLSLLGEVKFCIAQYVSIMLPFKVKKRIKVLLYKLNFNYL